MQNFESEDIKETLSQESLQKAKEFFEFRITANQTELNRVNTELATADGDKKKFLIKSKAGYEAKIAVAQESLAKVNSLIA